MSVSIQAGTYVIGPSHKVSFVARHAMVTKVRGYFRFVEGQIVVLAILAAPAPPPPRGRLRQHRQQPRQHLESADFFGAEHPGDHLRHTGIKDVKGDEFTLVGDLTIKGITKPVELEAEFNGAATDSFGNALINDFSAETEVEREDWGLTWNATLGTGGVLVSRRSSSSWTSAPSSRPDQGRLVCRLPIHLHVACYVTSKCLLLQRLPAASVLLSPATSQSVLLLSHSTAT